jgi:hypothetical protein
LPIRKRRISISRLTRLTDRNPFELEDPRSRSDDNIKVKKPTIEETDSILPDDNTSFFGGIGGIPKRDPDETLEDGRFDDILS